MSETLFEGPAVKRYRELLEASSERTPAVAPRDKIAESVSRTRQQLALRDTLALGFGGLVRVLLSLVTVAVTYLHRKKSDAVPSNPP